MRRYVLLIYVINSFAGLSYHTCFSGEGGQIMGYVYCVVSDSRFMLSENILYPLSKKKTSIAIRQFFNVFAKPRMISKYSSDDEMLPNGIISWTAKGARNAN